MDIYYTSVGRNSVLLLNIPPDTRGLIHETDAARLRELNDYLEVTFDTDLLIKGLKSWKADSGESKVMKVRPDTKFNTLKIREDITKGQRVEEFYLEVLKGDKWEKIAEGTTIGYNRLLRFPDTSAEKIRVTVVSARKTAFISEIGLYYAPEIAAE